MAQRVVQNKLGRWEDRIPPAVIRWRENDYSPWKYDNVPLEWARELERPNLEVLYDCLPNRILPDITFDAASWNLKLLNLLFEAHHEKHNPDFVDKYVLIFKAHWENRGKTFFGDWGMGYATYLDTLAGIDERLVKAITGEVDDIFVQQPIAQMENQILKSIEKPDEDDSSEIPF